MKQEEYVQGKWYIDASETRLAIFKFEKQEDQKFIYSDGYDEFGLSYCCFTGLPINVVKGLATPGQIETCLKAYAVKMGYVDGANIFIVGSPITTKLQGSDYRYDIDGDYLEVGAICYHKGQWAEIVSHASSVQDKQDDALTEQIKLHLNDNESIHYKHESLKKKDIKEVKIPVDGNMVSIQELIDGYQKFLDIKTITG